MNDFTIVQPVIANVVKQSRIAWGTGLLHDVRNDEVRYSGLLHDVRNDEVHYAGLLHDVRNDEVRYSGLLRASPSQRCRFLLFLLSQGF
ncbi:MAG: hypothetical protein LBB84_00670 [Tannerellaceae bacterium]|jgi:hypothetical protein|nr:hypothetical protein [Tannerellaceae bacterium]